MVLFCRKRKVLGGYKDKAIVEAKIDETDPIDWSMQRIIFLLIKHETGEVIKELTLEEVKHIKRGGEI